MNSKISAPATKSFQVELSEHQIKLIALSLVEEWKRLDTFQENHPLQVVDHVSVVQSLINIGLGRVANILNLADLEYLKSYPILNKDNKYDIAKSFILNCKLESLK